jgi:hypothetical protein
MQAILKKECHSPHSPLVIKKENKKKQVLSMAVVLYGTIWSIQWEEPNQYLIMFFIG